mmetsp:Transcript_5342/g.11802  ORF Transcript_5342/g.11802 Transcript_5342/m.11802 type:complete len:228 (+) Transcript_5342:113-796(+)
MPAVSFLQPPQQLQCIEDQSAAVQHSTLCSQTRPNCLVHTGPIRMRQPTARASFPTRKQPIEAHFGPGDLAHPEVHSVPARGDGGCECESWEDLLLVQDVVEDAVVLGLGEQVLGVEGVQCESLSHAVHTLLPLEVSLGLVLLLLEECEVLGSVQLGLLVEVHPVLCIVLPLVCPLRSLLVLCILVLVPTNPNVLQGRKGRKGRREARRGHHYAENQLGARTSLPGC